MVELDPLVKAFGLCGYFPQYQPIVRYTGFGKHAEVVGYEALCRRLERGITLSAEQVIAEVKECGMLAELDAFMAMLNVRVGRSLPGKQFISTNMSARSLINANLVNRLCGEDIVQNKMVLEITETERLSGKEFSKLGSCVADLKSNGWLIAIDDFGDGHGSLRYFNRINVDIVKLSRDSLVDLKESQNLGRRQFMRDLISSLRRQSITIVMEGVEEAADAEACFDLGVDLMQGFYFGAPSSDYEPGIYALDAAPRIRETLLYKR